MPAGLRSITIVALVSSHELDAPELALEKSAANGGDDPEVAVIPCHGATGPPEGGNTPMRIGARAAMKETA